ncbi:MAG: c-type cytochrome [Cocleimonas sp.]
MTFIKPILFATTILLTQHAFADDDKHEAGEKLYQTNCAVCHGNTGGMDMTKRIAPPIAAVRMHYISTYSDEDSFVEAVSNWVEKQDESKSMMRGAIQKFKIMPPISIPREDAEKIAAYIYSGDIEKPEGFEQHVKEEHGKMGMGKMHGQGMSGKGMQGMHQRMNEMMKQGMHGKGIAGGRHNKGMQRMMQKLSLSPQQQQQIQGLIQEKQTKIKPVKKQLHHISRTIRQLDTTSSNYKSQIFSLANEKANLVRRMVIEKGEMRMKIESVLNAEQRAKFAQFRQLKQQRKQKMMGH